MRKVLIVGAGFPAYGKLVGFLRSTGNAEVTSVINAPSVLSSRFSTDFVNYVNMAYTDKIDDASQFADVFDCVIVDATALIAPFDPKTSFDGLFNTGQLGDIKYNRLIVLSTYEVYAGNAVLNGGRYDAYEIDEIVVDTLDEQLQAVHNFELYAQDLGKDAVILRLAPIECIGKGFLSSQQIKDATDVADIVSLIVEEGVPAGIYNIADCLLPTFTSSNFISMDVGKINQVLDAK